MRVPISDLRQFKRAAKLIGRFQPKIKLSTIQEALAVAFGYRDFHEMQMIGAPDKINRIGLDAAADLIIKISKILPLSDLDIQYAISKSNIISLSLDQQLKLRCIIWRRQLFGSSQRGKPGTIVRDKPYGTNEPAYLIEKGQPTRVLFDGSLGIRADFEIVTPRKPLPDFIPARLWLPYGYWRLKDGSEIIFSRDYLPMWRTWGGRVERLDPWIWINDIAEQHYFASAVSTSKWHAGQNRDLALEHLNKHGIDNIPTLTGIMPKLFLPDIETIHSAVNSLYHEYKLLREIPEFAKRNEWICRDRTDDN